MKRHHIAAVALIFSFGFALADTSPSFDCSKASNTVERLICSDNSLAELDVKLSQKYKAALAEASDKTVLKQRQIEWIKGVRSKCTDAVCLSDEYKKRLTEFSGTEIAEKKSMSVTSAQTSTAIVGVEVKESNANRNQELPKSTPSASNRDLKLLSFYQDMLREAKVREECMLPPPFESNGDIDYRDEKISPVWDKSCACESEAMFREGGKYNEHKCLAAKRLVPSKLFGFIRQRNAIKIEDERIANITAKKEKEENEKRKIEQKVQNDERTFQVRVQVTKQQANVSPEKTSIWISPKNYLEDKRANIDANLCFGRVNENWRDNVLESNKFIVPNKSEFEKTTDYDKRVQLAQAEFASLKKQREMKTQEYFSETLNVSLGEPIVSDIQYNADSEVFKFNVISSICKFSIAITAKSNANDAPKFKEKLERLQPSVAFELAGETLFVRHVALFDGQTLVLNARPNVQVPYKFNDDEVKKYKIAAEKENARIQAQNADVARRREAELMQKQWYRAMKAINVSGMICDVLRDEIQRYGESGQPENIVNQIANDNFKKARQNGCVR